MPFFDVLQFRIHSLECVRETSKSFPEVAADAIDVRVVAIDESGDADVSNPILAGTNFRTGSRVDFPVPLVLYQFNLNEIPDYPRSYTALLTLTERDDEPFGSGVNDAIRDVARAVNGLIRTVVSAVGYGTVASIVAGILDVVLDKVFSALGSDMFPPQSIRQDMDSARFSFSGRAEGPLLTITCDGVGGSYRVGCSWARRSFDIPLDSTDPLVDQVSVILRTGGDTLRRASEVDLILGRSDADLPRRRISTPNEVGGIYSAPPLPIDPPMRLSEIRRVGLQYYSGQDGPFDTTDNWIVDEFSIRWSSSRSNSSGLLFSRAGAPLHRFEASAPIRIWTISPGAGRDTVIRFRSLNSRFIRIAGTNSVTATSTTGSEPESQFNFRFVGEGKIALQASNGRFLTVANSSDAIVQASDIAISRNSIFEFIMTGAMTFTLRAFNGLYVMAWDGGGGRLGAVASLPQQWETFTLVL